MICSNIMKEIEQHFPKHYAMEWDNVGLLVGRKDKEVKKIYIALDLTDAVLDAAITFETDLLLTHHPLIFKGMKRVTDQDFIGRRVLKLIQNDISYYAMHTNYDVKGMAELASEYLGMVQTEVLEVTSVEDGKEDGIGRVGDLKEEMTLEDCCKHVKEVFGLPTVKVYGDLRKKVKRVALCPGAGKSCVREALIKGAGAYITGDIDHHEGIDAVAQGMCIIDAGHYGTEFIYMEDMKRFCEKHFPEIEVKTEPVSQPFQVL